MLEAAEAQGRELTSDESAKWEKMQDGAEKKVAQARRLERQAELELGFEARSGGDNGEALGQQELDVAGGHSPVNNIHRGSEMFEGRSTEEYRAGFENYLARGGPGTSRTERGILQIDSDTGGGHVVVSDQFIDKLIKAEDNLNAMIGLVFLISAIRGESFGAVSLTGDISPFTMAGELTTAEVDDISLGKRILSPHDVRRKEVPVSKALLEAQTRLDVQQLVADRVAFALGSLKEDKIINGTGANQPLGLFVASPDGIPTSRDVATDNTATAVTPDNVIEVQGTLEPPYQRAAKWLSHRDYITRIRKQKDGNGQYLWQPGLQADQPNMLLGREYVTSEFAPNTFTAGQYVALYGDFSWYWFAHTIDFTIQRLIETRAVDGMIGLLFDRMAIDGMPVLPEAFVRVQMGS